ncbi:wall-associated receptor kinase-like protein 20, partial [Tanacetum coccineum]
LRKAKSRHIVIVATTVCVGVITFVTAVYGTFAFIRRQRIKAERQRLARERVEIVGASVGGKSSKIFTSKEIKRATNNFSSSGLLGAGGFGEVYKGILDDGTPVAVKCAKLGNTKSIDQVLNEVRILCQVNHKNLVLLLGCCVELEQPFLVYEYVPNGSLYDHMHGRNKQPLTWPERLGIAHDTAEGLAYLHFSASPPIYHRDIKSSNILLDTKMRAKVADFGLSRLAQTDVTHVTTCAQGTLGYLDPDYYWNYQLTDKSDVYSFRCTMLELLTCQKAIDFTRPTDDVNLVQYIKRVVNEERLVDAIDPMLKINPSPLDMDAMKAFGFLAMSCIEEHRENRPSMKEVAEEIEYIMDGGQTSFHYHAHGDTAANVHRFRHFGHPLPELRNHPADVSSQGLQLDPTLPFNITSGNTIMYLNCSESLLTSPLNCTSTSLCHSYINNSAEASSCSRAPICCTFRTGGSSTQYAIRVRDGGCQAYRSFPNLDYSLPVSRWPAPGVEIQWVSPPEPLCSNQTDCDASSTCLLSSTGGVRRCLCNTGLHWDAIEGVCVTMLLVTTEE